MAREGQDNPQKPKALGSGAISVEPIEPDRVIPSGHSAQPAPPPASIHLQGTIHWSVELADWLLAEDL